MAARSRNLDNAARTLLQEGERALGDAFWWPVIADAYGADVSGHGDRALELGLRFSEWAVAKRTGSGAVSPVELDEVLALFRSKSKAIIHCGARLARAWAELGEQPPRALVDVFLSGSARVRSAMVDCAIRKGSDSRSEQLLIAALADPSVSVREAAAFRVPDCPTPAVLAALKAAAEREIKSDLRYWMEWSGAMATKGYYIGPAKFGAHEVSIKDKGTVSVPSFTFRELGEEQVIARIRTSLSGVSDPGFESAQQWHGAEIARWHQTQDFVDFRAEAERMFPPPPKCDGTKRAAVVAELQGPGPKFLEAGRFLDGNEDEGSVGCNLDPHPGMEKFRKVIAELAARREVSGMYFEVNEVMEEPYWPFADTLLICTTSTVSAMSKWVRRLQPSDVTERWKGVPAPGPEGSRWVQVWWD